MFFLQHVADDSAHGAPVRVPVVDAAGLHLERALLSADNATRLAEIDRALAADRNLASWAIATAERRLSRTINRTEDAAEYLAEHLVAELAPAIHTDTSANSADSVACRLPALLQKLCGVEHQLADFERRLERDKLDAMKELAYGASHEINNPLANIAARAQTLLDGEPDPQRRQKLVAIHRQAMRAHEMISDLMLFARPPKLNLTKLNVSDFVDTAVSGLSALAQESGVHLECVKNKVMLEVCEMIADETQLGVALHAVVRNAIEAVDEGGRVTVAARQNEVDGNQWIEFLVRDDGPGISAEVRRHIFDPFFSGREAGRGLGFGLSKCWRIVTDHGGQVLVDCPAGGGTEISLLLPQATSTVLQKNRGVGFL